MESIMDCLNQIRTVVNSIPLMDNLDCYFTVPIPDQLNLKTVPQSGAFYTQSADDVGF